MSPAGHRSLNSQRILVTREADRAASTVLMIEEKGGVAILFPTIETAPPQDSEPLKKAVEGLAGYDWVVASSVTGVDCLPDLSTVSGPRFAAVGLITARAMRDRGAAEVLYPDRQDAGGLCKALIDAGAGEGRVLVLRAEKGRDVLLEGLREQGARVDLVVAYRTACVNHDQSTVMKLLQETPVEAALFMSPSSFICFLSIVGTKDAREYLDGVILAAVGRVTAAAMQNQGFTPDVIPEEPSVAALLDAVAAVNSS